MHAKNISHGVYVDNILEFVFTIGLQPMIRNRMGFVILTNG